MSLDNDTVRRPIPKRWFWGVMVTLALVISVTKYFGTYSDDAKDARRFLREMPVADIREVRLEPYSVMSLTDHVIVIRDRARIEQIAGLFRAMTPLSPNHPQAQWVALIHFKTGNREYGGQIEATGNQGALFWYVSSRSGWNYGCYRNDAIGPFFTQLVAAERVHGDHHESH